MYTRARAEGAEACRKCPRDKIRNVPDRKASTAVYAALIFFFSLSCPRPHSPLLRADETITVHRTVKRFPERLSSLRGWPRAKRFPSAARTIQRNATRIPTLPSRSRFSFALMSRINTILLSERPGEFAASRFRLQPLEHVFPRSSVQRHVVRY